MSINVYWASCDKNWMFQKKPDSVISKLNSFNLKTDQSSIQLMNKCPALSDELFNTYNMYSLYDYELEIDVESNLVKSDCYDQAFFDSYINVRSVKHKLVSYRQGFIFFTDADDLEVSFCKFPFLEENEITKRCKIIPGRYNISKWFRTIEMAFFLKDEYNTFKICKDDVMYYTQFHTNQKIKLKQFHYNDKLTEYANSCGHAAQFSLKNLDAYYKMFKLKKLILKEIKNNLVD